MTTPQGQSPELDVDMKIVDIRRGKRKSSASITNNTPYRQLQYHAKMWGLPCNLKKETLETVIKAKMDGNYEVVEMLLKEVREERLLRKKQRAKALEESKALENIEPLEENNNEMKPKECQETIRQNKVQELLHNIVKMSSARNVTIQKTSTHTRYRALIAPGYLIQRKCLGVPPSSTCTTNTNPKISNYNPTVINYASPNATYGATNEASTSRATAMTEPMANLCNNPQFGQSYNPETAVTVRETLLQQYRNNPVSYEPGERMVNNPNWTGGSFCYRPKTAATGSLPSFHSVHYNNQLCKYPQPYKSNQFHNIEPQSSGIPFYQSTATLNLHQADQQIDRHYSYGGFQSGIQSASNPLMMNSNFLMTQNSNYTPLDSFESSGGLQPAYPSFNTVKTEVPNEAQLPMCEFIQDKASKDEVEVKKLSSGHESSIDTDLSILANMAMTKAQEVIDATRSQNYNNGLLMIRESSGSQPLGKDEVVACGSKSLLQDIPTWKNFLEQMSSNLSPGVTNEATLVLCKYGCQTPTISRRQQLKHEEHCTQQPIQCPSVTCTYVGQLRGITTHMLNVHNIDIVSNASGSFLVNLTDGKCSFDYARTWLKNCPKKLCFFQLVDGRLFLIRVIGNFDSMQVVIYVQYVNDHFSWRSHIAFEVLRPDGLPLQFTGEVLPITFNPIHIISRRNCFIFNMNLEDWSKNIFRLHTHIVNHQV